MTANRLGVSRGGWGRRTVGHWRGIPFLARLTHAHVEPRWDTQGFSAVRTRSCTTGNKVNETTCMSELIATRTSDQPLSAHKTFRLQSKCCMRFRQPRPPPALLRRHSVTQGLHPTSYSALL